MSSFNWAVRFDRVLLATHVDVATGLFQDEQAGRRENDESKGEFPHDARFSWKSSDR
ncbi:MAG: hypothetical protein L6Q73_10985 [Aquabacterium sp.]|nr:hypothetical protein [Aquabacterium sp.]